MTKKNKIILKDLIAKFGLASQEFASVETANEYATNLNDEHGIEYDIAKNRMMESYNQITFFINNVL